MRILFVNQYYWPDPAATAQMLTDLAEHAARAGHAVEVIASRAPYAFAGAAGGAGGRTTPRLPREETRNGVRIHRVGATALGRGSLARRASDYFSFHLLALARMARLRRPDALVTLTSPPFIGAAGAVARALRGVVHVVWLMDVYPDLAVRFGALAERGVVARGAGVLERLVLRGAAVVIVLGEDMRASAAARGARPERIVVARNWADGAAIRPIESRTSELRQGLGFDAAAVVFGYSGNFGCGHRFEAILEVARRRRDDPRIGFLFAGDGPLFAEVRAFAARERLANVRFSDYRPREALGDALGAADVHFISQDPRVDGLLVPSKLYGILAAGRPIVFLGTPENEVGATLREGACGVVLADPDDAGALEAAILALAADPARRERLGRNGRTFFEARFERRRGCARVLEAIEAAACRGLVEELSTVAAPAPMTYGPVEDGSLAAAAPAEAAHG